ncbi:hypothetical protein BC941DRAFT_466802 [Chlamydoabsidia padenii]|nr:hypothetical protein BC941DRAFT_466802 [Chlamydoabsidia padenii]
MSIDSWEDILDTELGDTTKEGAAAPDHSSSSSLSTNERQLELNFERFNNLNLGYSSSSDISLTIDHLDIKTKPSSSQSTSLSPLLLQPIPEPSTSASNHEQQQRTEAQPLTLSHADTFAKWTPPSTNINGASLPWLSTSTTYQQQLGIDTTLSFRQKWNRMQQQSITDKPLPFTKQDIKTPEKVNNLDLINLPATQKEQQQQQQEHPLVFYFATRDQKQALDSIVAQLTGPWQTLRSLDLSHQQLTAIHQLETLTPVLETLIISHNQIKSLSDLPLSLKILKAKSNRLTDIEGFRSLHLLEYLDVCDNALETFDGMGSFYYLKVLMAENNKLRSCQALHQMHGLVKLKLRGNAIDRLNFDHASLYHLEILDVSYNRIQCLETLNGIPKLHELNLDRNEIESMVLTHPIKTLRVLKLNYNRLRVFDGQLFPNLRTLYLDNNRLEHLKTFYHMIQLDTLSIRDQQCAHMKDWSGARKLYLSGMPVKQIDHKVHFINLEYLELCGGQVEEISSDFASQVPQLRILYLSHNYLKHIGPLKHHQRLQKLVLIDNRFRKLGHLLEIARSLPRLQYLDTRNNPINSKMYADLIYTSTFQAKDGRTYPLCRYLGPEYDTSWLSREASHYQDLSEYWRRRRNMYRALFIHGCGDHLKVLDHVPITNEESSYSPSLVNDYTTKSSM